MTRKHQFIASIIIAAGLLQLSSQWTKERLKINLTDSMPKGIYLMSNPSRAPIKRGAIVEFTTPEWTWKYIYGRHWLPPGTPLLKHVAAVPGDRIMITSDGVYINGTKAGPVFLHDSRNLPLPVYRASFIVPAGYIFPLSTHIPNSFDGRYFGCISLDKIHKVAKPLLIF